MNISSNVQDLQVLYMVDVILTSQKNMYTIHYLSNDSLMRHNGSLLNIHLLALLLYLHATAF